MSTERTGVRLPPSAHTDQPWRIHEIAPDFIVEDVWALPTPGGPDDFRYLLELCAAADAYDNSSFVVRTMLSIRWKLGALLGWDGDDDGLEQRVHSLRERLPQDLRDGPAGPETPNAPFRPVYLTENEFVDELANKTVHALAHYSWVRTPDGSYRGQMAVLTKPNGLFGRLYMAGIKPIRHFVVYPALLRGIASDWEAVRRTSA
ncbi:DUF2867 domain-containing protein [Luteipulveratus mongoliensis]|uniref:DUF2867 domain-containing protein n=1 Tax=Luteipulveratus mongoliensis TaxID=571913 RepID=A0A0K1JHH5_9MICO|nr:DUF2867 domain-containing protein [Luteipulveratus mongoliensis]AKU16038.1 hypothetical protein VV02_09505 [Luteipulveratus mongoliensis]